MSWRIRAFFLACVALGVTSCNPPADIDTVESFDPIKYVGKWYQVYGNSYSLRFSGQNSTCTAADYALDEETGNITVVNSGREGYPCGELTFITGYAYGANETQPGKFKLHLDGVPVENDYWIARLGPESYGPSELYEWSIVTESEGLQLYVLTRDVEKFDAVYKNEVLGIVGQLGFTTPLREPVRTVQEGCPPFDPSELREGSRMLYANALRTAAEDGTEGSSWESRETLPSLAAVTKLDLERYYGRWYQAFGSPSVFFLLQEQGACITADYGPRPHDTVSVLNSARAGDVDGDFIQIPGFAFYTGPSRPGELTVRLEGVPFDAPYLVLALGEGNPASPYEWAIISDPARVFLFVMVREIEAFTCSKTELEVLGHVQKLGFTSFWNSPLRTVHKGCTYPEPPLAGFLGVGEELDGLSMKPVDAEFEESNSNPTPLHPSCKVFWSFPSSSCQSVSDALVAAGQAMDKFGDCNGGKTCGYVVSNADETSVELIHETSAMHNRNTISITLSLMTEEDSCNASGYSTSQAWYTLLDIGVNYCNLHGLVEATGLMYEETGVSDTTCAQYSLADCERH